ncbi:hypothetical protein N7510_007420 [Penicillium lagena]|uniref:uncharacterized protein n=1 Tax=Penicillium lagena TaxID=94218 RepID=UPI002541AAB6|nr:uncharacterized protein N7510_007420 [Penicillium lagena]KAJ5610701.1 hypothetical protein N7510_007420 [Penicillium lagena]
MSFPPSMRRTPPSHASNIFLFLLAFRLLNSLAIRTFFQPDEFFQSLEPAWQIAFGKDQGAWITWEWRHQLRSSLHPLLFAAIYKTADLLASVLALGPAPHAELLIVAPKTAQAVVSAIGDFYTWKLARRVYGTGSREAWTTLAVTVLNPWQWFCSTRTLSNCLETTITIVALNLWPWQWSSTGTDGSRDNGRQKRGTDKDRSLLRSLRQCLSLAALACILRPTNVLIWAPLASVAWLRTSWLQRKILVREVAACGSALLVVSTLVDRLFYGIWTFPPFRFLYFNIAQSLAVFYGRNDWHYYISQGYPLLLTTALPFAIVGLYRALIAPAGDLQTTIRVQLAAVCVLMPAALSLISHKEVRFIYPLLPSLHILAAPPLVQFFSPAIRSHSAQAYTPQRLTLIFLVLVNLVIAVYTTIFHMSGPLDVLSYLRGQHEVHSQQLSGRETTAESGITAGFLMPCHSTPWRSHLVHPTIHAWALSCEPPIDFNETQKAAYRDEADQFYDNPDQFLRQNMAGGLRHLPRRPSYAPGSRSLGSSQSQHEWPDYLVFFAQLESTLRPLLRGSSYAECRRTWNTHWHDDWRRQGDIVVWCLDPAEQDAWRAETHRRVQESRERQFDRIVKAFEKEARRQQKRGWKALVSPSSSSTLASWRRSVQSRFSSPSTIRWPWGKRSRSSAFWKKFPSFSRSTDWSPSWPEWLGGKSKDKKSPFDRDLWS